MARELSQEEVLDFLCQGGGKVANSSLLAHFKLFLRDPRAPAEQLLKRRERFKRYVNSVAVVKPEGAVKYVVLRSRYRDLLGEDLSQPPAPGKPDNREDDQVVPAVPHGAQVRDGRGIHSNGCAHQGESAPALYHDQQGVVLITDVPHGALEGQTWASPKDRSFHELKCHQPSQWTSSAQNRDSTSSPASNTSSPQCNTYAPHRSPSMEYKKSSPPVIRASDKFYPEQPMNTDLSSSNTSSPCNKSKSSSDQPYHNQSSPATSLDIPEIPPQVPSGHCKVPPGGQKKTESANPAFVNATSRDREGPNHGSRARTELQSSHFHVNGTFPPEEHKDYSDPIQEQQMPTLYNELPASPPSSRYMDSPHPSPSLRFPHGSGITPRLEDYQPASRSPSPPLPLYDIHDLWMSQMPVFKSIRCQLSLQDLEDFVDQESCGSEGSDSGEGADCDTEPNVDDDPSSDSNNDQYVHDMEQKCQNSRCPPSRKFLGIREQYDKLQSADPVNVIDTLATCGVESAGSLPTIEYSKSPYTTKSFLTDQAPILFELAGNPPRHKMSSRMQELMSSSDDELIERDYKKRRRPSRAKKPSNLALVPPQPDVDLLLTVKPVTSNHFITYDIADQKSQHAQYEFKVNMDFVLKKTFNYKSSTVLPLDSMEHDWIVKSATGSWLQVYGLFMKDPSLALRKDFISGFTAFHWFAKHGATDMFYKFVAGAKKAGILLDANVKSNGGYTPLHIAAIHGHHKVAVMLIEKLNVNVKLRDNSGKRAWQYLGCNTSGEVWQLLGAPKGKTIFASRALNITNTVSTHVKSSQINRKTSLAAFLKPQHQKWKANNHPALREREIYSD
ncbi:ankyrin repeat domain-containing protein SOWAHB [Rhinoderma darwinii]|uniref:ankyrin repeat domain-containing protein SOWAHB n=1 Tax=Rhinoderma darwinii TaxID=43563 RepID=UPI003F66D322